MAVTDVMQNALSTATGSVEKAIIKIRDERAQQHTELTKEEITKLKSGGGLGIDVDVSALSSYTEGLADMAMNALSSVTGIDLTSDGYNRLITVQFNPSSMRLRSNAGGNAQITNYTQNGGAISRGPTKLHVDLSVKLIFDQISNTAAFQQDNMTLSSTRVISSVAGALGNLAFGRKTQSVQVTVEAFIAALRNENTRWICFEWGEFKYEGIVRQINSTYTMFDISGNPIRAEVDLIIYLADPAIKADNSGYWYDAYYAAFIEGNPTAMAMMAMNNAF